MRPAALAVTLTIAGAAPGVAADQTRSSAALTVTLSKTRGALAVSVRNVGAEPIAAQELGSLELARPTQDGHVTIDDCYDADFPLSKAPLLPGEQRLVLIKPKELLWSPCISSTRPWGLLTTVVKNGRYGATVVLRAKRDVRSNEIEYLAWGHAEDAPDR
jgi:hypothetical protein